VHSGALGWVAMVSIGSLYYMIPRLFHVKLYSEKLVNIHFWMATIGISFYVIAMWVSGIMQGLMWRAYDDYGALVYTFAETVAEMHPYYVLRWLGGVIFMLGAMLMLYNIIMTIRQTEESPDNLSVAAVN